MWKRATIVMIAVVFLGFGIAFASVFKVAIVDGKELQERAIDQTLRNTSLSAKRGSIYDANGAVLAESASVWTVILEPAYIKDDETRLLIAKGLSEILDMDEEKILEKTKLQNYYTYLKREVETDVKDQILKFIADNEISKGIVLEEAYKRYYPNGSVGSVVLGFTGTDNQGLSGLEAQYDAELSGTAGKLVTAKNAIGTNMPFEYEQNIPAKDGYNLKLSIDKTVQAVLEKYLEEGIRNSLVANGATAILMDVQTGAIKGLAVKGDFDPNDPFEITDPAAKAEVEKIEDDDEYNEAFNKALQAQWRNKAVSDTYYPGSVFKMVTGSIGLELGVIDENTGYTCTGAFHFGGNIADQHCWSYGHGFETFVEGLCNSCNPFFIYIGQLIGPHDFYRYFDSFGFTKRTGIDLPGEASSLYHDEDELHVAELATLSYGQNFSITPIQMITACAAVANGGYLLEPYVVEQITDSEGNVIESHGRTVKRQVISENVSRRMTAILNRNATVGTAKNGYVAGYRICGKTGTSEKVAKRNQELIDNPDAQMTYIASYCGYAPADDPQYALLMMFDEPMAANYYGGSVAGPVFARVMEELLPYLGVERIYSEAEKEHACGAAPNVTGVSVEEAQEDAGDLGYDTLVLGSGETVIDQIPYEGSQIPAGGTIVLYTDNASLSKRETVPDFSGATLSNANDLAAMNNLQIEAGGAAANSYAVMASGQDLMPGEKVRPGTVVKVTFIEIDQVN